MFLATPVLWPFPTSMHCISLFLRPYHALLSSFFRNAPFTVPLWTMTSCEDWKAQIWPLIAPIRSCCYVDVSSRLKMRMPDLICSILLTCEFAHVTVRLHPAESRTSLHTLSGDLSGLQRRQHSAHQDRAREMCPAAMCGCPKCAAAASEVGWAGNPWRSGTVWKALRDIMVSLARFDRWRAEWAAQGWKSLKPLMSLFDGWPPCDVIGTFLRGPRSSCTAVK